MWDSNINTQTIIIPTPVDYQFIKNSVTATSDLLQCIENDINESRRIIRAKNDNSESYQQLITLLQQDNNVLIERVKVLEEEIDRHEMAMFQSQEAICTDYEDRILLNNSEMDRVISQCNKSLDEREDILRRYNDLTESHRTTLGELSSANKVIVDQQETIRNQSVTINDITKQNQQYIIALEAALTRCNDYELLLKQLNGNRGIVQASKSLVYSSNNQQLPNVINTDDNDWFAFNRSSNDNTNRLSADNTNRLSADNINRLSGDSINRQSGDSMNRQSGDSMNRLSVDNMNRQSVDSMNRQSVDSMNRQLVDSMNRQSVDSPMNRLSGDSMNRQSVDSMNRQSANNINRESADSMNIQSVDSMNRLSGDSMNIQSADNTNRLSADSMNRQSADSMNRLSGDSMNRQSVDSMNRFSADSMNGQSADSMNRLSGDSMNRQSADSMNRQSADSMKKLSGDSMNRLLADNDLRPQKPIHLSSNPGFGRDLASPEDDSMMTMQAYEYDDYDDAGGAAGNDYDSPLDSITKELGRSTVFEPKGGMFDDYAYRHRPLIDATDDTRDANDQSRDATEIVRGDQFRNRQSTADDYRLEVEGTMVDDDGVPYDDYRDRDVDEIIGFERESSFCDFAYDDDDKGPTEPFETNYYNTVDEDDSELGHDNAIDHDYGDRDDDDDDDGGSEGEDFYDDYDNDSLNGEQRVSSNNHSYDDDHAAADDDDDDNDSTATRLEVEKDHQRGYYDDDSSRVEEEGRYITVADDWEQLNLEELSRLSLASI